MMSAGSFIAACMVKPLPVLLEYLKPERLHKAATQHGIPPEWARHYLKTEIGAR